MKTILSVLLSFILGAIPAIGQPNPTTDRITIVAQVTPFGIELPDYIPQDIQKQIRIILASQEDLFSWSQFVVTVVIVVVVGYILYCLWRCSQMIPLPTPPQPPDDPAIVGMPEMLLYNMDPAESCELQVSTSLESPDWKSLCELTMTNFITIDIPESDRMFFRLESR